jgi:hypothetical protein
MERALMLPADHPLRRLGRIASVVGLVALAASALGGLLDPTQFFRSWLVAFVFWVGVALGCVALLMIHYVTGGAWGAVIRRMLEAGGRTLPLMAVAFLPVAAGVRTLYEWARPDVVAHDPLLQHKAPYLNVPFFLVRAVFYFAAWILVATLLGRWSLEQDASSDDAPGRRLQQLSQGGIVLLGLTMTFASVDWMMSLEPRWYSTIYGILFMGGSVLSAFAVVIPIAALLAVRGPLAEVVTPDALHDLGKLTLAFVMLWAYFAFSQFLIIWSGNLPEEIPWYLARTRGGWQFVALAIVVFHFALPFVVLLSRDVKRRPRLLATVALALLGMRLVDLFWQVVPAFHGTGVAVHWLDVATVAGVGGVWLAVFVRNLDGRPLLPLRDPSLVDEAA